MNDTTSDAFPRERGIFQGSALSPLLFNIAIDELAIRLDTATSNLQQKVPAFLLFADDIKLQVATTDVGVIQKILNICGQWVTFLVLSLE